MAAYYIYLISSLPMLQFGMKIPFSYEKFLMMCRDLIPEHETALLEAIYRGDEHVYDDLFPALKEWGRFDMALRNELVKIRAARKHIDPVKYLRLDGHDGPAISHIALNAHRIPSLTEAEKMLDQERWHALDEITAAHYFDIDVLIAYAYKLLILEKWERVRSAERERILEEALS
ncbi:MAG: DUF2764 family protein [Candidatus Omnitrophica bacterium]|nr:DUF2764 family protein [Candidatus Omnitrophota bacterium]